MASLGIREGVCVWSTEKGEKLLSTQYSVLLFVTAVQSEICKEISYVHYLEPATINDVATIKVLAQDATYSNTYYVAFNRLLSGVDTLKTIYVGGVPVADFNSQKMDYTLVLPYGTTELPTVDYETGDAYQTVDVIKDNLNCIIVVTAENGNRKTYMVCRWAVPSVKPVRW